ncbi:hypothetical protein T5B8_07303 [Salinisphaera sp. T5B8]|uniref:hypothetical protein n=1 Tax=Salinisphaera sp. T5B8 TaxID=1304154 RepID=UPI00333E9BA0
MNARVTVQGERQITANEQAYAKQVLVLKNLQLRAYVLIGGFLLGLGCLLIAALPFGLSRGAILAILFVGIPTVGLTLYAGRGIGNQGLRKRAVLGNTVCTVKGPVTYITHRVKNSRAEEFFVGDVTLWLPPFTSLLSFVATEKNGYRETELDVIFIETRSKQKAGGESVDTNKEAVVLYLADYIDIDTVFNRHGRYYLIRESISMFAGTISCIVIGALGYLYFFPTDKWLQTGFMVLFLAILADFAIVALGCYLINKLYLAVRKRLDPNFRPSSYGERLAGKA